MWVKCNLREIYINSAGEKHNVYGDEKDGDIHCIYSPAYCMYVSKSVLRLSIWQIIMLKKIQTNIIAGLIDIIFGITWENHQSHWSKIRPPGG